MQIDRSRFLMLTASIAAGGCSGGQTQPVEVPEQTVVVVAPVPMPVGSAQAPIASAEPEPAAEEPPPPMIARPSDEDMVDPADQALIQAPATCGNTTGTVGACTGLRPAGPTCESFLDTVEQCNGFVRGMQPRAASKAVACLAARSGRRDICQFDAGQKCAQEGVKAACIEPFSAQPCRTLMSSCSNNRFGKISMQQCQRALSAVKGRNRPQLMTCMTESCSADYCFYALQ
jgi:hypothetical protein